MRIACKVLSALDVVNFIKNKSANVDYTPWCLSL